MNFELAPVCVAFIDDREDSRRLIGREMDPVEPSARTLEPDVTVSRSSTVTMPSFRDVQNPARDGTVTAADDVGAYVLRGSERCSLPQPWEEGADDITYSQGFPVSEMFSSVVRPALQIALLRHGSCAIHSAAAAFGPTGVVVAGWSESGKTETVLALGEEGARFLSDKWTVLRPDGTLGAFPISVGVRRWVLDYLPRLRRSLPTRARAQLVCAGLAGKVVEPLHRAGSNGRVLRMVAESYGRAVALADRASLRQSEIREVYGGDDAPHEDTRLSVLALLTTVQGQEVSAQEVDIAWAARRLARTASYERRPFFDLHDRVRYASPDSETDPRRLVESREEMLLREALPGVRVLEVRAPFPVDPRRVAEAVGRWL